MTRKHPHPVLFLDIDDVLCLNQQFGGYDVLAAVRGRHKSPDAVFREVFDRRACQALEQVHNATHGRLRYVVSSTWRAYFECEQLCDVFRRGGLGFVASSLHHAWRTSAAGSRADDIAAWLDQHHENEPFAVVDDSFSGPSLRPDRKNASDRFAGRVVLCDENVGLLPTHVEPLLAALRQPCSPGMMSRHGEVL